MRSFRFHNRPGLTDIDGEKVKFISFALSLVLAVVPSGYKKN